MSKFTVASIRRSFNDHAEGFAEMATRRRFIGGCFALALLAMPFSTTVGMLALATPTVYFGLSLACRLTACALKFATPNPPAAGA